jgi:hypothetical protein
LGIRQRFQRWKAHRNLRDFFALGQPILDVQLNGVLNVLDGFLVRVALAVAALKRGTRNEVAIGVRFDDNRKSNVFHNLGHYMPQLESDIPEFAAGCEKRGVTWQPNASALRRDMLLPRYLAKST